MFSRFNFKTFAAAVAALATLALAAGPAGAEEPMTQVGPVGPYEPILTTLGSKRLIAFYVPDSGRCAINAVVFDSASADAPYSASRARISLWPGEVLHLDGTDQQSIDLRCGEAAAALTLSGPAELISTGATN
ncbi:MAG: hypothetical protein WBE08_08280 [Methyloceanibacter sp.]|jgi:hypothetical protein